MNAILEMIARPLPLPLDSYFQLSNFSDFHMKGWHTKHFIIILCVSVCVCVAILWFELRASGLLGRHSAT
jgi:hypothetical protein